MAAPKLLDPAGLSGLGPRNLRKLVLPRLGEVARALVEQTLTEQSLTEQTVKLLDPDALDQRSLNEWQDAVAEEILLLAQVDRPRAQRILAQLDRARSQGTAGPLGSSRPFRHGPELS